jgi:ankyrin repeat protein
MTSATKFNTQEEKTFFTAIDQCDFHSVRSMVANNPSLLDSYDHNCFGATPLTRVCFGGYIESAKVLIELGADVNRKSDWNMGPWSPLHCAVTHGHRELAQLLLDSGATLDAHTAAGLGWIDQLKKLLEQSTELVHERGGDGVTPLHFANSIEVADLLILHGADINARCVDHYSTPVQYLAACRPQVAKHLIDRGAELDIFTAVLVADIDRVQSMIEANPSLLRAKINQAFFPPSDEHDVMNILTFTIGEGCTLLHAATRVSRCDMIRKLVELGMSTQITGGYDEATPLHLAAWNDCDVGASELIRLGAKLDQRSGRIHNNTPAGWAIVAGSLKTFRTLMDAGATQFEWFLDDAKDGANGKFDQFRRVPQADRQAIMDYLIDKENRNR